MGRDVGAGSGWEDPGAVCRVVWAVVLAAVAGVAGCDRPRPNSLPFEWGGPPTAAIIRLSATFQEPNGRTQAQCRKAVRCLVARERVDGANLPNLMNAFLVPAAGGTEHLAAGFVPDSRRGSTYTFRAKLRMPGRPGTYRLRVDSTYGRDGEVAPGSEAARRGGEVMTSQDDGPYFEVHR